jgi:hypothetical protein
VPTIHANDAFADLFGHRYEWQLIQWYVVRAGAVVETLIAIVWTDTGLNNAVEERCAFLFWIPYCCHLITSPMKINEETKTSDNKCHGQGCFEALIPNALGTGVIGRLLYDFNELRHVLSEH